MLLDIDLEVGRLLEVANDLVQVLKIADMGVVLPLLQSIHVESVVNPVLAGGPVCVPDS